MKNEREPINKNQTEGISGNKKEIEECKQEAEASFTNKPQEMEDRISHNEDKIGKMHILVKECVIDTEVSPNRKRMRKITVCDTEWKWIRSHHERQRSTSNTAYLPCATSWESSISSDLTSASGSTLY